MGNTRHGFFIGPTSAEGNNSAISTPQGWKQKTIDGPGLVDTRSTLDRKIRKKKKRKNFTLELGYNGKDPIRGNSVKLGKLLAASVKNRIFVATWVSSSFFFFLKNQIFAFVGSPQFWPFFFVQRQAFRNAKNSNGKLDFKNDFYGGGRRKNVHSEGFCWAQSPLLCCCLLKSISSHSCSFSFLLLLIFSLYRVFFQ